VTVAFALSGGGNLGPLQAGTVLALLEAGIEPDLLVGTSVGSLNAAFLSTRPGIDGAQTLVSAWSTFRRSDGFRFSLLATIAGFLGFHDHLIRTERLRGLIRRWVEIERIEDAVIPFGATATDALTGDAVLLRSGEVVDALVASSAIPGIFPPVRINGRWLIDGSLSAGCPVLQAQAMGADEVYLITTTTAPRLTPPRGAVAIAMNSVSLVTARASREQLAAAQQVAASSGGSVFVVPSAEPPAPSPFDFTKGAALSSAAYDRTVLWLGSREFAPETSFETPDGLPT
jgi:NTE family protein